MGRKGVESALFLKGQLISGAATAVDWALALGLTRLGLYYLVSIVLGALSGAATDFSLKKWWLFAGSGGAFQTQLIRYAMVSGTSALLNAAAAYLLVEKVHLSKSLSIVAAGTLVGFCWNYPMHRLFVFSRAVSPLDQGTP